MLDSIKAFELLPKFTQDIEDRIEKALDNKPDFGFDYKNWRLAPSRARKWGSSNNYNYLFLYIGL